MKRNLVLLGLWLAHPSPLLAIEAKPTDADSPVPRPPYRSAFDGYRSASDESIADWRGLNEEVAAAGGHAAILRGMGQNPPRTGGAPPASGAPDPAHPQH